MGKIKLPMTDSGYYEIRLESIGGLGANLCGKMLGELGVKYLDLNSASFSSYGSEKTGTPVKGFIRYCEKEKEIRVHSPVITPNLLVIFHQALLKEKNVWAGCNENTEVIIAIEEGQETNEIEVPDNLKACYAVKAQKIAMETHARINVVMLGAMARVLGFVALEDMNQICADALGKKYPDALRGNLEGIKRGHDEVKKIEGKGGADLLKQKQRAPKADKTDENKEKGNKEKESFRMGKPAVKWGYDTAPIGGINPEFGNTVATDLSPSRQGFIPLFIKERCINCGMCDSTCPDMVFQFAPGQYKGKEMMVNQGLDYYHCKGCLRCVEVCPVNALVRGIEAEHPRKEYFMPNQDLLRMPDYYIKAGPDGYVTSESYLTEKRMEGGEV
ncbi:2-oxoacid:acceptor oxidoreductase family protein [Parablautia muri]|uniref:4Fe-4S dicluster domain-containing protein n=1 Tax=Parablautia muri TaxID=2320879 RepID=A0A9X5BHQ8_9FIRM|nr:2-oxoacid:acceptor oxidoreductase family protein [Parablautia muri]NBJ93981.1 4Fe-4S dicluster domain-containing protein [Parablautia muri]